ncbi:MULTISPECIES: glyoxalase [Gordonia]|uniref:Glyoxalase n=1 Tax=Gordonia amicalis TaxID=89053 RepID=A0AAE4R466_9ACTN|nr:MULTISPECIES: glyoxalase [Gordonia]ATD72385.1 glyoxalase [Gordonia sp. 1D]MCR8900215.1 glyoxalase [Gordonia sp. GONU]MCZ4578529.1 glyoxalase [Gordonia amicalis]MCZ4651669.1 glyoxalase [Gordonia amicalis]MDJ0455127.1 glyoxalase [Gordonia amicalis]
MTNINALTLEVPDISAAEVFYDKAFGLGDRLRFQAAASPSQGFRGFVISLVVADPTVADSFLEPAIDAGATVLKPAKKSFWGYGGVVQAPDGAIWKVASSSKKPTGARAREFDDLVLLLGVDDVAATKQFYVDRGFVVGKSYGRKYVEFESGPDSVKLALYGRKAAAKDAGVDAAGSGSHRLMIGGDAGQFVDPDGFSWE